MDRTEIKRDSATDQIPEQTLISRLTEMPVDLREKRIQRPVDDHLGKFPTHCDIDLSTKCNLRCRFCHLSFHEPEEWTQISYDKFLALEPLLRHLKSISLFSKYETLTCRDLLPIFDKICEYDIETYFSTNGVLLSDEIISALVGRLTFLTVSITGITRDSYIKNMGQDRLETVRQNLAKLCAEKRRLKTEYPRLRITTVCMLDNLDELCGVLDFAKEIGAEEGVRMTYLRPFGQEMADLIPASDPEKFATAIDEAIKYADKIGVKFEPVGGALEENENDAKELGHRKLCSIPWEGLSFQPNGDVYPCALSNSKIGNFFEDSIDDIWNGEKLTQFRAGVNDPENMNEDCLNCGHCRYAPILDPGTNEYLINTDNFWGGMKRKKL